jgi:hypothetical protein
MWLHVSGLASQKVCSVTLLEPSPMTKAQRSKLEKAEAGFLPPLCSSCLYIGRPEWERMGRGGID